MQARAQVSAEQISEAQGDREGVYNQWYNKWTSQTDKKERSPFKLNVSEDSGLTKGKGPFFCLWFARGMCKKGSECRYLHRIPCLEDCKFIDHIHDCFGRTKFGTLKEDMSGVGSLMNEQTSIFVGYINQCNSLSDKLSEQFGQFGNIAKIRCGSRAATIEYENCLNAQFAKEAMSNQTITGEETLSVLWAKTDKHILNSSIDEELRNIVQVELGTKKVKTN